MENSKIKNPQVFKHCVLEDFRVLLKHKLDFSGSQNWKNIFLVQSMPSYQKRIFSRFFVFTDFPINYAIKN